MRFLQIWIKAALLHQDPQVRQRALNYFAEAYSPNPTIMPVAIEALETYGRDDAFPIRYRLCQLAQTEETVAWVIRELQGEARSPEYLSTLGEVLLDADPRLTAPRVEEIVTSRWFPALRRGEIQEQAAILSWDEERCWAALEAWCRAAAERDEDDEDGLDLEQEQDGDDPGETAGADEASAASDFSWQQGDHIVAALAAQGAGRDRVLDMLRQDIDEADFYAAEREIALVELAGLLRLPEAAGLIVSRFRRDGFHSGGVDQGAGAHRRRCDGGEHRGLLGANRTGSPNVCGQRAQWHPYRCDDARLPGPAGA